MKSEGLNFEEVRTRYISLLSLQFVSGYIFFYIHVPVNMSFSDKVHTILASMFISIGTYECELMHSNVTFDYCIYKLKKGLLGHVLFVWSGWSNHSVPKWNAYGAPSELVLVRMALPMDQSHSVLLLRSVKVQEFNGSRVVVGKCMCAP